MRLAVDEKAGGDRDRQPLVAAAVVGEAGLVARLLERVVEPAGLDPRLAGGLRGGDAETNAKALKAVLEGAGNAYQEVAVMNAAAALVVADAAADLKAGVALAKKSIQSGAAKERLARLVAVSNG